MWPTQHLTQAHGPLLAHPQSQAVGLLHCGCLQLLPVAACSRWVAAESVCAPCGLLQLHMARTLMDGHSMADADVHQVWPSGLLSMTSWGSPKPNSQSCCLQVPGAAGSEGMPVSAAYGPASVAMAAPDTITEMPGAQRTCVNEASQSYDVLACQLRAELRVAACGQAVTGILVEAAACLSSWAGLESQSGVTLSVGYPPRNPQRSACRLAVVACGAAILVGT